MDPHPRTKEKNVKLTNQNKTVQTHETKKIWNALKWRAARDVCGADPVSRGGQLLDLGDINTETAGKKYVLINTSNDCGLTSVVESGWLMTGRRGVKDRCRACAVIRGETSTEGK